VVDQGAARLLRADVGQVRVHRVLVVRDVGVVGAELRHVELRADAVLDAQRPVVRDVVGDGERLARDVRGAEQVRVVLAGVVLACRTVAVAEGADVPVDAAARPEQLGQAQRDERLVDAQLTAEVAVARVVDVDGGERDGRRRDVVAVGEAQLGPRRVHAVEEAPVGVVVVRQDGRRVDLGALLDAVVDVLRGADADASRHADEAGGAELDLTAVCLDVRRIAGQRRGAALHTTGVEAEARGVRDGASLGFLVVFGRGFAVLRVRRLHERKAEQAAEEDSGGVEARESARELGQG
jgi:hypothetical protein